jgi:hypothetical protein
VDALAGREGMTSGVWDDRLRVRPLGVVHHHRQRLEGGRLTPMAEPETRPVRSAGHPPGWGDGPRRWYGRDWRRRTPPGLSIQSEGAGPPVGPTGSPLRRRARNGVGAAAAVAELQPQEFVRSFFFLLWGTCVWSGPPHSPAEARLSLPTPGPTWTPDLALTVGPPSHPIPLSSAAWATFPKEPASEIG